MSYSEAREHFSSKKTIVSKQKWSVFKMNEEFIPYKYKLEYKVTINSLITYAIS